MHPAPGARRSVRAVLVDDAGRVVLLRRTRPGRTPYWTAPGGGVEPADGSDEAALRRELGEELGATVGPLREVFRSDEPVRGRPVEERFFLARLVALDLAARHGPELGDPSRGTYTVDRFALDDSRLGSLDLRPAALRRFLLARSTKERTAHEPLLR